MEMSDVPFLSFSFLTAACTLVRWQKVLVRIFVPDGDTPNFPDMALKMAQDLPSRSRMD
ncbi:MAG: hypothetical protein GY778_06355 [bacterium]|nr:hypothetical protein [bacterium]